MKTAKDLFYKYLKYKNLKRTEQRETILNLFLKTEEHVSTEEFYRLLAKRYPSIGYSTVYRTLKLICKSGIAREVDFGDGMNRFEHNYGHEHHDHLICIECGRSFEVLSKEIEKLQDGLCKSYGFKPLRHKMEIFGICRECRG